MFKELHNFSKVRTRKEAFGFYIAYLLLLVLGCGLLGGIVSLMLPAGAIYQDGFEAGGKAGAVLSTMVTCIFASLIVYRKKLFSLSYFLLVVLSGFLALLGGALLGLIPVTYLTTRPVSKGKSAKKASK